MANKIEIELAVLAKEALSTIKSFSSDTKNSLSIVEKSFAKTADGINSAASSIKSTLTGLAGAFAFKELIHAGLEADKTIRGLEASLKLAGEAVDTKPYEDLATEIMNLIGVDDELVISQATLLKSIGASNKQIDSVIRTAANLSTVFNQDLGTSVNQLIQVLNGTAPKALAKFVPELKNLAKEGKLSAEGIDAINKRLPNLAAELQNTGGVQVLVAQQNFGNLVETIGKTIIRSDIFVSTLKAINSILVTLNDTLANINFSQIYEAFVRIAAVAGELLILSKLPVIFGFISGAVQAFKLQMMLAGATGVSTFQQLKIATVTFAQSINVAKIALNLFKASATLGLTLLIDQFIQAGIETKNLGDMFKFLGLKLEKLFLNIASGILSALEGTFKLLGAFSGKFGKDFKRSFSDATKNINASLATVEKNLDKLRLDEFKKSAEKANKKLKEVKDNSDGLGGEKEITLKVNDDEIKKILANPTKFLEEIKLDFTTLKSFFSKENINIKQIASDFFAPLSELSGQKISAIGTGFLTQISKGSQGARELLQQIGGVVGDLLGGFGEIVSQLVGVLSQSPEQFRAMIQQFFESLPQLIENIIVNLAELPRLIGERIPELIQRLVERLPYIAIRMATELSNQMPFVATRMAIEFVKNVPQMVAGLVTGIVDAIKEAIGSIGNVLGIGGGGGGIIGGIGDFLGFAKGGYVPAGFPNDTFPASLSSGEYVIDRSLTSSLTRFLDSVESGNTSSPVAAQSNQQQSQNLSITLNIGEEQLANVLLNLNRQGFRIA